MRPPEFWSNPPGRPGWQARVLAPLALVARRMAERRAGRPPELEPDVPVLCVGNLSLGGAGKTPTAVALAELLGERKVRLQFVTRGYGGDLAGPVCVNPNRHTAADVGDEPLLLSSFAPVWVAKDRAAGVRAATEAGAEAVVLDDGFQNPAVRKDLSLIVVDAVSGFGNGRVFPSGPLREPIDAGLRRAHAIVLIGDRSQRSDFRRKWHDVLSDLPILDASLEPLQTGIEWADLPVLAFAGIGRPEKFFETLRGLGANVVRTHALDDHQPIPAALLDRMHSEARGLGARLVTTEKDLMRLPKARHKDVTPLMVRLRFDNPDRLAGLISRQVPRR